MVINVPSGGMLVVREAVCWGWGGEGAWETSVPSTRFCYESKTALKTIYLPLPPKETFPDIILIACPFFI